MLILEIEGAKNPQTIDDVVHHHLREEITVMTGTPATRGTETDNLLTPATVNLTGIGGTGHLSAVAIGIGTHSSVTVIHPPTGGLTASETETVTDTQTAGILDTMMITIASGSGTTKQFSPFKRPPAVL